MSTPPIATETADVLTIAKLLDIRVVKNSIVHVLEPNTHGIYLCDGETQVIVYDDTRSVEQSKFTIAHELGHILLRHATEYTNYMQQLEKQADHFAQQLLTVSPLHISDVLEDLLAG